MKKNSRSILLFVLLFSGSSLYALPAATLPYSLGILLHLAVGLILAGMLVPLFQSDFWQFTLEKRRGWVLLSIGAVVGVGLIFTGTLRPYQPWLYLHIGGSLGGIVLLASA